LRRVRRLLNDRLGGGLLDAQDSVVALKRALA
jgi:hypothetical protein